jgi:hypothetical protein
VTSSRQEQKELTKSLHQEFSNLESSIEQQQQQQEFSSLLAKHHSEIVANLQAQQQSFDSLKAEQAIQKAELAWIARESKQLCESTEQLKTEVSALR